MPATLKEAASTARILTGRMVLAILVVFFAVVIGVNVLMARLAAQTFRGLASNHAYAEGLAYNREIEAAHAQDALGWRVSGAVTRIAPGRSRIAVSQSDASGQPTGDAQVDLQFLHPVDRARDKALTLTMEKPGLYTGEIDIAPGHWGLALRVMQNGQVAFQSQNKIEISDRTP